MPAPVTSWVTQTFPTAKSLNLALYTCDGTADNPNGIAFHSYRPILFEAYGTAATFTGSAGGSRNTMTSPGPATSASTRAIITYDSAGYFGQFSDMPSNGFYQFQSAVAGSSGDGIKPGGWHILSHFVPVARTGTQVSVGADVIGQSVPAQPISGTRQPPPGTAPSSCPFFLDLINVDSVNWQPAVSLRDSGGSTTTVIANTADSSGETCRFYSIWAAISSTSTGTANFNVGGIYSWTAPPGVTSVNVAAIGAGAGGGAGNTGGVAVFGGGGGGGGGYGSGPVAVTPNNNYVVTVGVGGLGGVTGISAGIGNNGAASLFAGDSNNVTVNGGNAGLGAGTSSSSAGGLGGTVPVLAGYFHGGAGAAGLSTGSGTFGGGGGSSAGATQVGADAVRSQGAPAPPGGGPGGAGGQQNIVIVQTARNGNDDNSLTLNFPHKIQAGNTVIACVIYQGQGSTAGVGPPDPTVTLSDGTHLVLRIPADINTLDIPMQLGLFDIYNVTGGQTGIIATGHGVVGGNRAIAVQMWEVSGLGPNPTIDASGTFMVGGAGSQHSNYPPVGSSPPNYPVSTLAPELWIATVAGQQLQSFTISPPSASQGWTAFHQNACERGPAFSRILSAYNIVSRVGTMQFSGTMNLSVSQCWIVAGYVPSGLTSGLEPVIGSGGGGGGGLSATGTGGNGFDGAVTLSWTVQGGGYGTPALPAPFSNWADTTTIGANGVSNVNLNGNTGIRDVCNFLSNPPIFRIGQYGITVGSGTVANLGLASTSVTIDNYGGFTSATGTYTIQRDGLYLFHGLVCFAQSAAGTRMAAATINGVTYWGPASPATSTGQTHSAKTQIFSLRAGDTVQLACRQTSGGSLAMSSTDQTRFLLVWLCAPGLPATAWNPPDTTFRWISGTSGDQLSSLFQQHLANDLGFLVNRPFFLGWQNSTPNNFASQNVFSFVILDAINGIIHGDNGDNYGGWTLVSAFQGQYVAQVSGWYLMVGEMFVSPPATTSGSVVAAVQPETTSGGQSPSYNIANNQAQADWYQQLAGTSDAAVGGGAAIFGLQYLSAGEAVSPGFVPTNYGGSFANTLLGASVGGNFNCHFEMVWISE